MNLCNKDECTGCSACINICPKKAISFIYNEMGFLEPKVDSDKCINCNLCSSLCEKLKKHLETKNHKNNFYLSYINKIKDDKKRMESQSGGLFSALAETILEKNGVVYGAGIDEFNHVKHYRIDDLNDLSIIKGSKYVQSDIGNSFEYVIDDLKNNKYVLFSGTPCQVAGIETLLNIKKINKDKFYSCDVICHGVPSPKVFEDFISLLETNKGAKIKDFNFRDKTIGGWKHPVETYRFQQGRFQHGAGDKIISDIYCDLFYSNLTLRKSCEKCKYCTKNRPGDLTMADCWGIEKINPDLWNDDKGISICLIQTEHGKELFDLAAHKLDYIEYNASNYTQVNLEHPTPKPFQKDNFWKDYKKYSFKKIMKKYTIYGGIKFKFKRKILRKIGRW